MMDAHVAGKGGGESDLLLCLFSSSAKQIS